MAISQNTLIGSTKQSVGGVTFTKWKGRNVIKAKAVSVANPKTPAQAANRNQFAGVSKFYSTYKSAFSLAMLRLMGNVTDGNRFSMLNKQFFETETVGIVMNSMPALIASVGDLGELTNIQLDLDSETQIVATFDYVPNAVKAMPTDKFRVICIIFENDKMVYSDAVVVSGSNTITIPCTYGPGQHVIAWAYSYSASGKLLSNSVSSIFTTN